MNYEKPSLTVDCVVFYITENSANILLIQRGNTPFKGNWALPGGFVDKNEPCEKAVLRELQEETGLVLNRNPDLVGVFSKPGRDPRGWTISIAYYTILKEKKPVKSGDDAVNARFFNINALPELAFDHAEIISKAIEKAGL